MSELPKSKPISAAPNCCLPEKKLLRFAKMAAVIHQAYFLPWLGYFSKLAFADTFIVLDDVQFRKRFYHDRTKIIDMHGNETWIGLPVGEHFGIRCMDVLLADKACVGWIVATISQSYAKAHHYDAEMPWIKDMLQASIVSGRNLVDINLEIITSVLSQLMIPIPRILRSSAFTTGTDPTRRVIELCKQVGATEIILGGGSSHTVHDWEQASAADIKVTTQDFLSQHPVYSQTRRRRATFLPGLSVIDAILNVGSTGTRNFLSDKKFSPICQQDQAYESKH